MSAFVGSRRSSYLYLKGIKLNAVINNGWDSTTTVHVAIVQDRDNNNSDLDREQNFFRDTTSLTSRAHPFNNWVSGDAYDWRQRLDVINSDHYNVITHMKFNLDGRTQTDPLRPTVKHINKYFPIKRRIAFDNLTDTVNWRPFYICMWWNEYDDNSYVATDNTTRLFYRYKTEVVFKNIL